MNTGYTTPESIIRKYIFISDIKELDLLNTVNPSYDRHKKEVIENCICFGESADKLRANIEMMSQAIAKTRNRAIIRETMERIGDDTRALDDLLSRWRKYRKKEYRALYEELKKIREDQQ